MSDTVHWRDDGTPVSPRFGDVYRSAGADGLGGLAQARQVFLHGCCLLPTEGAAAAWVGAARWAVLETGFGLGLNFLATWQAWRQDARRPARLFYSAVEAFLPEPQDLLRSAAPFPELMPLAAELAAAWHGLLPGVHRLALDGGRVLLTLAIGEAQKALRELSGEHDAIFLDGFNPARNPEMWSAPVMKAVARLARRGARAASWCVAREVREHLASAGFDLERVPGLPPKRNALRAVYQPRWSVRRRADEPVRVDRPARCVVLGAGLAGASAAYSLAQRGWQVSVLDRAAEPAAGASGLPAGVVAPHVSPDDRPLSRLTRAGARATLARAALLLRDGIDYGLSGVLERHAPGERRLPADWHAYANSEAQRAHSHDADDPLTIDQAARAGVPLDEHHRALWHAHGGWIRPAALVRALLQAPGIEWRGGVEVARLVPAAQHWRLLDTSGVSIAEAELVLIAAGFDSRTLLHTATGSAPPLHALRGQVAFGPMPGGAHDAALPPFPVNGHGSLIGHLPSEQGHWWVMGSTFERGNTRPERLANDHAANRQRLRELLPRAAEALDRPWDDDRAQAWAGVRATLPDRLPAVGAWGAADPADPAAPLPPHLLTGLGARGLTLAVLCGELLAAGLHGEPLPVERTLAQRLRASRWLEPAA
ncbi:MAG: FAD-dependent 5-carboxymethylaminomethyl-2-thiouridine(34) oxidoreductase MnmC [Burkholderiales bacterium]|nr:FAD-dependent 5-carboxymethylaminomethyl-2-thiouridine(34) oxidoreductase MnmC [Burkholderiales bacterium]